MEDLFHGIVFSDGNTPLIEEWINPVFGYQAVHSVTDRILPSCQRHEIYTWEAMIEKIENVAGAFPHIDTSEYYIEPIYEQELDKMSGYVMKMSNRDFLGI